MIDVIIPAYNAHETIETTLNSIALQTAREFLAVTVVNDNGNGYKDIVDKFKDRLNIKELHKRVNGGAGQARQYGMDNTKNPYIFFVDADDVIPTIFAIQQQFAYLMQNEKCIMVSGNFLEETPETSYQIKQRDTTWVHGKMYRRSHIDKHHIHFSDLRLCEDVEFNMRIKLKAEKDEHIHYMTDNFYYLWKYYKKSITRHDTEKLPYRDIVIAGTEACYRALKDDYPEHQERFKRGEIMYKVMEMYNYYVLLTNDKKDKPEWLSDLMSVWKKYWVDIAKPVYRKAPQAEIANMFLNRDKGNVGHIIPNITLESFINKIEKWKE